MRRCSRSRLICAGPGAISTVASCPSGTRLPCSSRTGTAAIDARIAPRVRGEADAHRVADGAVDDLADLQPAERAHGVGHGLRVDAGPRDGLAIDRHGERVHAGDLLGAHVLGAGDAAQRVHHAVGGLTELGEIVAVEMNREVRRDAGEEIVGVHLDGLAEREARAGDALRSALSNFSTRPSRVSAVFHSRLGLSMT